MQLTALSSRRSLTPPKGAPPAIKACAPAARPAVAAWLFSPRFGSSAAPDRPERFSRSPGARSAKAQRCAGKLSVLLASADFLARAAARRRFLAQHTGIATHRGVSRKLFPRRRTLKGLWASEGIQSKWEATSQAKKRSARALRATANDYERFQIQLAKKERSAKRAKA